MQQQNWQAKLQKLKQESSADHILFGHPLDDTIKIKQKVEIVQKNIAIHEEKVSTSRLQQMLQMMGNKD